MVKGSSDEGEEHFFDAVLVPTNNSVAAGTKAPYKHLVKHPGQKTMQATLDMRTNPRKRRRGAPTALVVDHISQMQQQQLQRQQVQQAQQFQLQQQQRQQQQYSEEQEEAEYEDEEITATIPPPPAPVPTQEVQQQPQPSGKKQRKPADHTGGPWTEEQDAYLEQLIKEGHKVLQIQNKFEEKFQLGRSRDAVRNRVKRVRARTMELSEMEERLIKEEIRFVQDPANLSRIVLDRVKLLVPNATQGLIERYMKEDKDVQLAVALDGFRKGKISRTMKAHMRMVMGEEGQNHGSPKSKKQAANANSNNTTNNVNAGVTQGQQLTWA